MAFPAETWSKIRAEYETGNFSIPELADKYSVSIPAIKRRTALEGWEKGAFQEEILEDIREQFLDELKKKNLEVEAGGDAGAETAAAMRENISSPF